GLAPREASIRAMEQVAGPVVAVGLVLSAVFVPCAFISGLTGQFFRQFALTIASSTIISAFNSLTLSPALAAVLLRTPLTELNGGHAKHSDPVPRWAFMLLAGYFGWIWLGPVLSEKLLVLAQQGELPAMGQGLVEWTIKGLARIISTLAFCGMGW